MQKLKLSLTLLIFVLNGCDDKIKVSPHFIDTDLMEVREYGIIDAENLIITQDPIFIKPITAANGMFCIPMSEVRPLKEYWLKKKRELEACK